MRIQYQLDLVAKFQLKLINWKLRDEDINRKSCQNANIWHTSASAASVFLLIHFERVFESRVLTVNIIFISVKSN